MRDGKMYQFPLSNPPSRLVLAPFSAKYHTFTRELALFTLIIEFKKVEVPGPKNPTRAEYHNTCNISNIRSEYQRLEITTLAFDVATTK